MIALAPAARPLFLVIDFKNIHLGAQAASEKFGDARFDRRNVAVDADAFCSFVSKGRRLTTGYGVAPYSEQNSFWPSKWGKQGVKVDFDEPGKETGRERGDVLLHLALTKLRPSNVGVVALATGDGNGSMAGEGFIPILKNLRSEGFSIEIYSWENCLNRYLNDWARENGKVLLLDRYFKHLTFVRRSGRSAMPFGGTRPNCCV